MSKFTYEVMSNDEVSVFCGNKKLFSKEKAIEQAKIEMAHIYDTEKVELEVISSVVQFGFWRSPDGEVYNSWYCPNIYEPPISITKTQVPVWLVRVKDEFTLD